MGDAKLTAAYESNTSDIRDKIADLCASLRSGQTVPRDIAGWLLLHHAQHRADAVLEMVGSNAHQAALSLAQDKAASTQERTIAATLLLAIAAHDDVHEAIARLRTGGRPCSAALLETALHAGNTLQLRTACAHVLARISRQRDNAALVLQGVQAQGALDWAHLSRTLCDAGEDAFLRGHLALLLRHVLLKRDSLVREAGGAGLIAALLKMATQMRRDYPLQGCMGCLAALVQDRELLPCFVENDALRLCTDVLGPPPPGHVLWEFTHFNLWRRHHQADAASDAMEPGLTATRIGEVPGCDEAALLSLSSLAIPFTFDTSVPTKTFAAECLQALVQAKPFLDALTDRHAAHRLTVFMLQIAQQGGGEDAKKPPKKGKPLAMDAQQVAAYQAVTGCLKLMTTNGRCAYQVARLGALPLLLQLRAASNLLVRRNSSTIIANVAMLADNAEPLRAAAVPAELLPAKAMKLPTDNVETMRRDFTEVQDKQARAEIAINGHLLRLRHALGGQVALA